MKKILIITCLVIFSSIKIVYSQNAPALKELTEAPEEIVIMQKNLMSG